MALLPRAARVRVLALILAATAGCATPPPPPPTPAPRPPESQPPWPTGELEPRAPERGPPSAPPAPAPLEEPAPLPWVNPVRCLSPCTYHPTENLVRVDASGALAPDGPYQVAKEVVPHLGQLLGAAASAGHALTINSAFRSYEEQARLFSTIKQPGRAAMPGQSEHQVGTAIDLKLPSPEAADWLSAHAARFGFVRSYPMGKQKITGYRPEPWHVRYVGQGLAAEAQKTGRTLEELFRERPSLGVSGSCEDCPARARRKPCGKITTAGACTKGVLLSWCYEGALATVDCSAFGQRCEATGGGQHDCR